MQESLVTYHSNGRGREGGRRLNLRHNGWRGHAMSTWPSPLYTLPLKAGQTEESERERVFSRNHDFLTIVQTVQRWRSVGYRPTCAPIQRLQDCVQRALTRQLPANYRLAQPVPGLDSRRCWTVSTRSRAHRQESSKQVFSTEQNSLFPAGTPARKN